MSIKNRFKRKNIRLTGYDYCNKNYYFITICTKERKYYFGEIEDNKMELSKIGRIAHRNIEKIETWNVGIKEDKFQIMPNHIHLILILRKESNIGISKIVQKYKGTVSHLIGQKIWQKSFFDRVIGNKEEYINIWKYIDTNVENWWQDKYRMM